MKKIFLITIIFFIALYSKENQAQDCYELVWNDEFNYDGLPDSTLWHFEEGGSGWGNNELQYYTSKRLENAHVEDGFLTIEARKENYGGRSYTSARLITYQTGHSWKYGKIEARIKLPYGQGIWPAFWMLGNGIFEGTSWPGCGEIDILELVGGDGRDNVVHGSIHYTDANNAHASNTSHYDLSNGIFADDFHTFSIEWNQDKIKWFVDGNQYFSKSLASNELSEIQKEFFLLLNIAVGGDWPGSPDATTVFPQKMVVDYVRVYQKNNQPEIFGTNSVYKAQKNITYKTVESQDFIYDWIVPEDAHITNGQGSNSIDVTWGCEPGTILCQVTTTCSNYVLELPVETQEIKISGKEKIDPFSENIKYSLPELNQTEFTWEFPNDVTLMGSATTHFVTLNWGNTDGFVKVTTTNNCGIEKDSLFVEIARQLPYPDPQLKHAIPGTIEAINYDSGGEGFAYHDEDTNNQGPGSRQDEGVDTEPNDGGENIGWIKPEEWVEYTVQVDSTGLYDIELRIASLYGGGEMEIFFSNENRTGPISIPSTGAWNSFTSIFVNDIQLINSDTLMKLQFNIGGFNISRLIFTNPGTSINLLNKELSNIFVYPVPAKGMLFLHNHRRNLNYHIFNLIGEIQASGTVASETGINISNLSSGAYFINIFNNRENTTLKFIKQ